MHEGGKPTPWPPPGLKMDGYLPPEADLARLLRIDDEPGPTLRAGAPQEGVLQRIGLVEAERGVAPVTTGSRAVRPCRQLDEGHGGRVRAGHGRWPCSG